MSSYNDGMATTPIIAQDADDWILAELAGIEAEIPKPEMARQDADRPGLMGRLFGRPAASFGNDRRLLLEASSEVEDRVAVIVAYHLLHAHRKEVAGILPEALFDRVPEDDEERFMLFADTAREITRQHLGRDVLNPPPELRTIKLQAILEALEDDSVETLAGRLHRHLNAGLLRRGHDLELAKEDDLLIEIDNVILDDVREDGTMAYALDIYVDGNPLATVASIGDGSIEVLTWLGGHGSEDLENLRSYVSMCGEPRSDEHGERPDSLEEVLLDRVTALFARYALIQARSDTVLFCDPDEEAPGGHVIRAVGIDPDVGREATWEIVSVEYPRALLLDMMDEDDAFTLWLAYSTV